MDEIRDMRVQMDGDIVGKAKFPVVQTGCFPAIPFGGHADLVRMEPAVFRYRLLWTVCSYCLSGVSHSVLTGT